MNFLVQCKQLAQNSLVVKHLYLLFINLSKFTCIPPDLIKFLSCSLHYSLALSYSKFKNLMTHKTLCVISTSK